MARSIDVQTDIKLKKANPEDPVQTDDGRTIPVKQRLEERKVMVHDAAELLLGIDLLLAMTDEELDATSGEEFLKVADDMIQPAVGGACTTEENENGTYQQTAPGKMTCIPAGKNVEEYLKEKVEKEAAAGKQPAEGEQGGGQETSKQ